MPVHSVSFSGHKPLTGHTSAQFASRIFAERIVRPVGRKNLLVENVVVDVEYNLFS